MELRFLPGVKVDFAEYVLIAPTVSVGNVGQLACDLVINSLQLKKVGFLWSTCVLPVVGSNAFSWETDNFLTSSLEVFADDQRKLAVLQQRSPIVPGKQSEFTEQLIGWVNSEGFREVILLTGCHAYERKDDEILGSPIRYLAQPRTNIETGLKDKNLSKLKRRKTEVGEDKYFMPGGGIAKHFHEKCSECHPNLDYVILMIFCSEGDNIPESLSLANALNSWKKYLLPQKEGKIPWAFPASWKFLFGARQPASIF